jgi:pectinesterase
MHEITIRPGDHALQNVIDSLPADDSPAVIRLAPGEYREKVELHRPNTTIEGAGADVTRIVWADAATTILPDGVKRGTFRTYTLLVLADRCTLRGLTVQNAAAPRESVGQCIALFADGDLFTCEDVTLLSAQDTLFTAPLPPREVIPGGHPGGRFGFFCFSVIYYTINL